VSSTRQLAGRGVVITRPAGEAQRLAGLISDAGGVPLLYPAIDILDTPEAGALNAAIDRLDDFDLAIFISPSAVDKAMSRIRARRAFPAKLRCAAIGPGGVRALQRFGIADVITPPDHAGRHDSESLLASEFMQNVTGRRIVMFHGDGGRELLGKTLVARGAHVEAVTCYRRGKPAWDAAPLMRAWAQGEVAAVIITSSEGVRNLFEKLDAVGQTYLRHTLVAVPHPRIAAVARELGMTQVAESASGDVALVQTVIHHLCG
jgi:uroporphyrinogen-III synthase